MKPKWTKQAAGFYTFGDTGYGVVRADFREASDGWADRTGNDWVGTVEWAAAKGVTADDHNAGENLDWFDTMREARAFVERAWRTEEER